MKDYDYAKHISIFDLHDDGEHLWFTSLEYNALFRLDKASGEIHYVGSFPGEEWFCGRLYTQVVAHGEKLYFVPCTATEIGVYDMAAQTFHKINFGLTKETNDLSDIHCLKKFASGFVYEGKLFLIPCCYQKMVICDLATGQVEMDGAMYEYYHTRYAKKTTSPDHVFYLCWIARRIDEARIVFDLHSNVNKIVLYDFRTRSFSDVTVGQDGDTFSYTQWDGRRVILYETRRDCLVCYDLQTKETQRILLSAVKKFRPRGLKNSFVNMGLLGGKLWLIPAFSNVGLQVNLEAGEVSEIPELSNAQDQPGDALPYLNLAHTSQDGLYVNDNRLKAIVAFDATGAQRCFVFRLSPEDVQALDQSQLRWRKAQGEQVFDEQHCDLATFVSSCGERPSLDEKRQEGLKGEDIYDAVVRQK